MFIDGEDAVHRPSMRTVSLGIRKWDARVLDAVRDLVSEHAAPADRLEAVYHQLLDSDPYHPSRILRSLESRVQIMRSLRRNGGTRRFETVVEYEDLLAFDEAFDELERAIKALRRDICLYIQTLIMENVMEEGN